MRKLNVPPVLSISILALLTSVSGGFAAPPTLVWNIGIPDIKSDEFEHENQGDDVFYLHDGDYSTVAGWDVFTQSYSLIGSMMGLAEPLIDPDPTIGFERALVGGGNEDTINIFFQLNPGQIPAGAKYRFDAVFSGIGGHSVTFGINGTELTAPPYLVGNSDGYRGYQQIFTAEQVNAVAGSNVLTLRTDNQLAGTYTTLDYLRLTLIDPNVIFSFGANDNSQADFEQESDAQNNPQFYVHAGDYTGVMGSAGGGLSVAVPERVKDDLAGGTEGLPRALTSGRPKLDLFFQLTPEEIAAGTLRFEADLFSLGTNSTHDLVFKINGVTLGTLNGIATSQLASFDFIAGDVNAIAGSNVISIERIGGGADSPWIQFDYLQLSTVPEPSSAALLALGAVGLGAFRRRR